MKYEATIPNFRTDQTQAIHQMIIDVASNHVERMISRMWKTVIVLALSVLLEGLYIAYITGTKVQELDFDHAAIAQLQVARGTDEINLASMNATLGEISIQLNRIEVQTKP